MRAAPSRVLMEQLWQQGARVQAFDPEAMEETTRIYDERGDLKLCDSSDATLDGADALIIVTEWTQFRSLDFDQLKSSLKEPVIFDGRNLYDPEFMEKMGFTYYAIGHGKV